MVEMEDFLTKMEVVDEGGTASADAERVLIIRNRSTLGRRQDGMAVFRELVQLASFSAMEFWS